MVTRLFPIASLAAQVALVSALVRVTFYSDSACNTATGNQADWVFGCNNLGASSTYDVHLSCLNNVITSTKYPSTNGLCTGVASSTTTKGRDICGPDLSGNFFEKFTNIRNCPSTAYAAGNDPIARFGDRKIAFELPPHELVTLLSAPEGSIIRGSVFEGHGPWEQWFDRIVLTTPANDRFLDIKMKNRLDERNYSKVPKDIFKTMDVTLGVGDYANPLGVSTIDSYSTAIPENYLGYQVAFRPVRRNYPNLQPFGGFPRECVDLAGMSVHLYVCSSPATEYFGHFRHLALRFAHLDMAFIEGEYSSLTGLLPELWGVQPMSESTKKLVKEDVTEGSAPNASKTVTAGGLGAENLTKDCLISDEPVKVFNV